MRVFTIPKGNGQFRVIYAPSYEEKVLYRRWLRYLMPFERAAAAVAGTSDVAHGFIQGRSVVTMAHYHKRGLVTISCDIRSWYDSVTPEQICSGLALTDMPEHQRAHYTQACCYMGDALSPRGGQLAPRQGLPTSPVAANLAAIFMDRWLLENLPAGAIYTRYADDLTVSLSDTDARDAVDGVIDILTRGVAIMGWELAAEKTSIQRAKQGRRLICGLTVDAFGVYAPRRTRRRLRAAKHQRNRNQVHGLAQWCACKLPNLEKKTAIEEAWEIKKDGSPESMAVASDRLRDAGLYGLAERCARGEWTKKWS